MSIRKSLSWLRKDLWQRFQNVAMTLALLAGCFQLCCLSWRTEQKIAMKPRENEWLEIATLDCDSDQVFYNWGWRKEKKNTFFESGGKYGVVVSFGNINVMYRVGFMAWSYLEFRRLKGIKCWSYSMGFGGWMVDTMKREICAFKALCIAECRGGILEFIPWANFFFYFQMCLWLCQVPILTNSWGDWLFWTKVKVE